MFNKVPEQDPFAVSNEAEENIKLFPSFKVSVKFSLPYYDCCLHSFYHFYSLTYVFIGQIGQYNIDIQFVTLSWAWPIPYTVWGPYYGYS